MRKEYIIALSILILTVALSIAPGFQSEQADAILKYHSSVCVYKNNILIRCSPNTLTNAGKNWTRDSIGNWSGGAAMDVIALGNSSVPAAGSTTLTGQINECGLTVAKANYWVNQSQNGSWHISKVFTASCAIGVVNSTALYNSTGDTNSCTSQNCTMFAGNTFSNVALQTNDQLNITWSLWITEGT